MGAGTYDHRSPVQERTIVTKTGQLVSQSQRQVGSVRTSTAIRRRRRPTPLDTTGAQWRKVTIPSETYEVTSGMFTSSGTAAYCWPSGPVTYQQKNSQGSQAMAIDRATRAFASNTGAGISAIEMPSTVRMIGRRAKTFYDVVRLSGKGDFRGVQRAMKRATGYNISNKTVEHLSKKYGSGSFSFARASAAWLEYNFGWKSFFQSIFDSATQLASSQQVFKRSSRYEGAKAGFQAQITNNRQFNLNKLGLTNPLEIAWDAVRLSFVVDWFIPISPFLRSLSAGRGLGRIYGYSTYTKETRTFSNLKLTKIDETFYRRSIKYSAFNLRIAPTGGLWKTITSLALLQGLR